MTVRKAVVLTLAGFAIAACDTRDTQPGVETEPGEAPMPEQQMLSVSEFEAQDGAQPGAVPLRGTAELRQVRQEGDLELHVRLEGLTEGDHPWHIHQGACGAGGPIVLALSDAPNQQGVTGWLSAGGDGVAEERITIDADRARALDVHTQQYSLNVHAARDGTVTDATRTDATDATRTDAQAADEPTATQAGTMTPVIACANIGGHSPAGAQQY